MHGTTRIWTECEEILLSHMDMFSEFTKEDLDKISPNYVAIYYTINTSWMSCYMKLKALLTICLKKRI